MPVDVRSVGRRELDLPPLFSLHTLRESGDAFASAQALAPDRGAGTLVWARRFDLVEFAVVLEPEEPLALARLVLYPAMSALADAIAVHCPPEKPLAFGWPDALHFDDGLVGGGRLAWPAEAREDEAPPWLVFGVMLRAAALGAGEPGTWRIGTTLEETGFFEGVDTGAIVESFARHLMANLHEWQEAGAKAAARRWLERFPGEEGAQHGIDANGDLIVRCDGEEERRAFRAALAEPSWLDPARGEPWL
ncbi:biotin/lipoate--protein ligase family protein [Chelatococcus sp. SYSU_G07232]|uniref:Biotin/lipoate--protein ligase family protein n=1 Tax=Chelatococcus albus TaxID=3047466 RepID=A0ABT7AJQ5_9HYPH|nr:biotin/lipoate--protein ligase family protein [Chelatococcus sp. SYSU_G07232]MDJ1159612.1 biotin/lipoate--protein ligase family protein [Chelatococcus sp. SYSU_G07232]